jgi:hypothetical protein
MMFSLKMYVLSLRSSATTGPTSAARSAARPSHREQVIAAATNTELLLPLVEHDVNAGVPQTLAQI